MQQKLDELRSILNDYSKGHFDMIFDMKYLEIRGLVKNEHAVKDAQQLMLDFLNKYTVDSLYKFYSNFAKERKNNIIDGNEIL